MSKKRVKTPTKKSPAPVEPTKEKKEKLQEENVLQIHKKDKK